MAKDHQIRRIDLKSGDVEVIVEDERIPESSVRVGIDPLGRIFTSGRGTFVWYTPETRQINTIERPAGLFVMQWKTFPVPEPSTVGLLFLGLLSLPLVRVIGQVR